MPLKPKYCSQCGAPVETRFVEDRPREVCPKCDEIFYRNPLPVASALVLNKDREILLVRRKRDPERGMWCLPIGFAELAETIEEAAVRELREETGIHGRVLRLLDADSVESDFYGDLLVVTFEMEKTGGVERAGDDAEEVGYFPAEQLPPLAFSSNEKAVAACLRAHQDEWAIRDSYDRMQAGDGERLLSDALVSMIEQQAEQIAERWLEEVRSNPTTNSYRSIDPPLLVAAATTALSQFSRWLRGAESDQEVRAFYRPVGHERIVQGVQPHEMVSSLTLLRRQVHEFARRQGVWERPIDVYRVLELNRRIVVFFDKAAYHMVKGSTES
jgi:8-oxo-dGTP diphosphatase